MRSIRLSAAIEGTAPDPPALWTKIRREYFGRTGTMGDVSVARDRMIQGQSAARGITDPRVLEAMRRVPREAVGI